MKSAPDIPLKIENLAKRFGGIEAVKSFTLETRPNQIHAVIGPNGAGKTTLAKLIGGETTADHGNIWVFGKEISHLSIAGRARLGLGRSFQITKLFEALTVAENIKVALLSAQPGRLGIWKHFDLDQDLEDKARRLLERFELHGVGCERAGFLAHGQKRALELALTLAAAPGLLILDEPLAGTAPDEARQLTRMIGQLKSRACILLIEHDMEAVFRLADHITVMVDGEVIASGTPEEIRKNQTVIEAYLGDAHAPS